MRAVLCSLLLAAVLPAQSLKIYSEYRRIGPAGEVVEPDRGGTPREILSPAIARHAFASFHVAASVPDGEPSFLYVQQNPERLRFTVYRERFEHTAKGWIPDKLEPVKLPYFVIPEAIPGQNTVVFWLDLWVPRETPAERMRVEVLLRTGEHWVTYPMEVRIRPATVPAHLWTPGHVPPLTARADAAVCFGHDGTAAPELTVRQMLRRNAAQDAALAGGDAWCSARPGAEDPEWFLRVRQRLYQ